MCIFKRIKKTLLANTDKILAAALPTLNYNFILTAGVKSSINQNNNKRMFKYFSFSQDSSCRQNLINKRKKNHTAFMYQSLQDWHIPFYHFPDANSNH